MSAPPPRPPRGAPGPRRRRWRGLDGRADGTGLDPAPGRARRSGCVGLGRTAWGRRMAAPRQVLRRTQAERGSLGKSQRSARLGSARLGSARLGSALMMRANGPGRFCQVFLRVIHNFSPSVPFRADDRSPPHTSREKWSIRTGHRLHRKTSFGPLGPGRSGALKRLVFLCLCLCRLGLSRRCRRWFPALY